MDVESARTFLATNHHGILLTYRADGGPQMSPVVAGVDADGYAIVSSRETAFKVKNLLRDSRASLCVFADRFYGDWVQVDGAAEIITLPDALEPLVDYYRRISGEHPDWGDYRDAMRRERRVLIRVSMDRAGPARFG